jgi:predicted ATPase
VQLAHERAEAIIRLASEQGFAYELAIGTNLRGWVLAEQGQAEEGIAQMHHSLAARQATGAKNAEPYYLALLAEAYGKIEQGAEGLRVLAKALAMVDSTGERVCEAELYRLKGELTLQQQFKVQGSQFKVEDSLESGIRSLEAEAEECFLKAIEIAQKQQAKALELRAVMSLVRLRQRQVTDHATRHTQDASYSALAEAHNMLSEVYNWFTEGFDTKDLQEAKALLDELAERQ